MLTAANLNLPAYAYPSAGPRTLATQCFPALPAATLVLDSTCSSTAASCLTATIATSTALVPSGWVPPSLEQSFRTKAHSRL